MMPSMYSTIGGGTQILTNNGLAPLAGVTLYRRQEKNIYETMTYHAAAEFIHRQNKMFGTKTQD